MHSNSDVDSNQLLKDLEDKFRKTLGSVNVGEEPNITRGGQQRHDPTITARKRVVHDFRDFSEFREGASGAH